MRKKQTPYTIYVEYRFQLQREDRDPDWLHDAPFVITKKSEPGTFTLSHPAFAFSFEVRTVEGRFASLSWPTSHSSFVEELFELHELPSRIGEFFDKYGAPRFASEKKLDKVGGTRSSEEFAALDDVPELVRREQLRLMHIALGDFAVGHLNDEELRSVVEDIFRGSVAPNSTIARAVMAYVTEACAGKMFDTAERTPSERNNEGLFVRMAEWSFGDADRFPEAMSRISQAVYQQPEEKRQRYVEQIVSILLEHPQVGLKAARLVARAVLTDASFTNIASATGTLDGFKRMLRFVEHELAMMTLEHDLNDALHDALHGPPGDDGDDVPF